MTKHHKVNYLELPASSLDDTEAFYGSVFGWRFIDYGPEYRSFNDGNMDGGFYKSDLKSVAENGAALIVLLSEDLETTYEAVKQANGQIVKEIFSFPGGRRFHFTDPSGNELAVWSTEE